MGMSTTSLDWNLKFRGNLNADGLLYLISVVLFSGAACVLYLVSQNLAVKNSEIFVEITRLLYLSNFSGITSDLV